MFTFKHLLIKNVHLIVSSLIILVALLVLDVFKPEATKKAYKPKKLKVFIELSEEKDTQLFAYAQGEAKPKNEVGIRSQVEGKVTFASADFVVGGRVEKGQLLLSIDGTEFNYAVVQREAAVAQARQNLLKVQAQTEVARQELVSLGRENPSDLALWVPQLAQAEAEVKSAQSLLDKAKLDLSRTKIYAPFDGVVRSESVSVGQQINRNTELATLYAVEVMEVTLALSGEQLGILDLPIDFYVKDYQAGREVELHTQVGQQTLMWPAKLMRTSGQFDTRTRTIDVVAEVRQDQSRSLLLPGLFVNAKIFGRTAEKASILARTYVKPNNKLWYVDDEGFLQVQTVYPIYRNREHVVVTGLKDATKIVTSALVSPTPGVPVYAINLNEDVADKASPAPLSSTSKKQNQTEEHNEAMPSLTARGDHS